MMCLYVGSVARPPAGKGGRNVDEVLVTPMAHVWTVHLSVEGQKGKNGVQR